MDNRRTTAAVAAGAAALALVGAAIAWQVAEGGDPGTVAQTSASASSSVPPSGSRPTVTSTAVSRTSAPPASATSTGSTPSSTSAGTGEGDPATCSSTEVTALLQRAEELPERARTVAQTMRRAEGYLGYRVGIAEDGRWMFATAGD